MGAGLQRASLFAAQSRGERVVIGSSSCFSLSGLYRYRLERVLAETGPRVCVLGVNPSIAGSEREDPTTRKLNGFGRRLGWQLYRVGNEFAHIATDVKKLADVEDPVGPRNDEHLEWLMLNSDIVIAAWGPLAKLPRHLRDRWRKVVAIANRELQCWGTAKDGHPRHPLMLPYDTPLQRWDIPV